MINFHPEIARIEKTIINIRRDIHKHPELSFKEYRTADLIAKKLDSLNIKVTKGVGKTGVIGDLIGSDGPCIALRADMDALPIQETGNLEYKSINDGVMHACGHDGHTTMLLGAAKYLASKRSFSGSAVLIFQPAEEGLGGADKMIKDGLFRRFPCDEIYGIHNTPNGNFGQIGICKGVAMAGAAFFDITVVGKGSHAAMPQQSKDPIVISSNLVSQLQSVVSRTISPSDSVVLSVTKIRSGSAYNIIPETCSLSGTIRYFSEKVYIDIETQIKKICRGLEVSNDITINLNIRKVFDVLVNDSELSDYYMNTAEKVVGKNLVDRNLSPVTGSEDFADMLKHIRGAYCRIGHSGTQPLHSPNFVFDMKIIPVGASVLALLAEDRLS